MQITAHTLDKAVNCEYIIIQIDFAEIFTTVVMDKKKIFTTLLTRNADSQIRTTFMLSDEALAALKWLQEKHNITFRDLADIVRMEYHQDSDLMGTCVQEVLDRIDAELEAPGDLSKRKTLSLGQSSIIILNELSRSKDIPRDYFVNGLINYAKSCIMDMMMELEEDRKLARQQISEWIRQAEFITDQLNKTLPQDVLSLSFERIYNQVKSQAEGLLTDNTEPEGSEIIKHREKKLPEYLMGQV